MEVNIEIVIEFESAVKVTGIVSYFDHEFSCIFYFVFYCCFFFFSQKRKERKAHTNMLLNARKQKQKGETCIDIDDWDVHMILESINVVCRFPQDFNILFIFVHTHFHIPLLSLLQMSSMLMNNR